MKWRILSVCGAGAPPAAAGRSFSRGNLLLGLCLLAVSMASGLRAADAGNFARGNERYAAGDYAGAVQAYETQIRRGEFGANLFYNLGDAYYRLDDRGRAILNYRRALLLEPAHPEAAANLAFIGGTRGSAARSRTAGLWQAAPWGFAACGWLGAAGLLAAWVGRRYRLAGIGLAVTGCLLCAAGAGLIWTFDDGGRDVNRAVVVTEAAPALYSPVDNAKVVTKLPVGGEVRVLSEQGAWLYVLLGDGRTLAWLAAKDVERLVPKGGNN